MVRSSENAQEYKNRTHGKEQVQIDDSHWAKETSKIEWEWDLIEIDKIDWSDRV